MNKKTWFTELKSFQQAGFQSDPIPARHSLSEEEEWHCRIIGGEFIRWYQHHLSYILQQRMALQIRQFDREPLLVFTTSIPGLVAAREIIKAPIEDLVCLLHHEFEKWEIQHPVDEFNFHIHHWSYFQSTLDGELLALAQTRYPEIDREEFRLHSSGDLWGEGCGVGEHHLWRWHDRKMQLIEESLSQINF
jgi:hypothetical protein